MPYKPLGNNQCWWKVQICRRLLFFHRWATVGEYSFFSLANEIAKTIKKIDEEVEAE